MGILTKETMSRQLITQGFNSTSTKAEGITLNLNLQKTVLQEAKVI